MASHRLLAAGTLLLLAAFFHSSAAGSSSFDRENPIRSVTDRVVSASDSAILRVLGSVRHARRFARFAHRFGKTYGSAEEIVRRFGIFSENLELIRSTNRMGLPYTLGINHFADWSWEEFRASRLGAEQKCSATVEGNLLSLTDGTPPETKDWRKEGIVSPVKDQGDCGSCWTFR